MMMIIMMIMVLPCSDWRKGMHAFSSLSPSETVCAVAWCGRLAQEEKRSGGAGNKGGKKSLEKENPPQKVTPSESRSMCEFRQKVLSCIREKVQVLLTCAPSTSVVYLL